MSPGSLLAAVQEDADLAFTLLLLPGHHLVTGLRRYIAGNIITGYVLPGRNAGGVTWRRRETTARSATHWRWLRGLTGRSWSACCAATACTSARRGSSSSLRPARASARRS